MVEPHAAGTSIREQQRAFTRERLLQGALEVFARKGYISTTIDDIVGAVGASRATFYLHFRTKGEVIAELSSHLLPESQAFYEELDGVLAEGSREAMRGWMVRAFEWMEQHRDVMAASDAARLAEPPQSYLETVFLADRMPLYLARWPEELKHQAKIRVALMATQFRANFQILLPAEEVRSEISNDELVDAMTDIWLAGLQPPESKSPRKRS